MAFDPTQLAALVASAVLGAMLFFAAVVAPTVFRALPADAAGAFLRKLFPLYYDVLSVAALLAALLMIGSWSGLVLFGVAALFLFSRFWLMPRINAARDASMSGNATENNRFGMLHRVSVVINVLQMIVLAAVIAIN